jgi:hypothetical protein
LGKDADQPSLVDGLADDGRTIHGGGHGRFLEPQLVLNPAPASARARLHRASCCRRLAMPPKLRLSSSRRRCCAVGANAPSSAPMPAGHRQAHDAVERAPGTGTRQIGDRCHDRFPRRSARTLATCTTMAAAGWRRTRPRRFAGSRRPPCKATRTLRRRSPASVQQNRAEPSVPCNGGTRSSGPLRHSPPGPRAGRRPASPGSEFGPVVVKLVRHRFGGEALHGGDCLADQRSRGALLPAPSRRIEVAQVGSCRTARGPLGERSDDQRRWDRQCCSKSIF